MPNSYKQAIQTNTKQILPGTRVLFANIPADGHFNPLTGLAVHLLNKGCDVRWYTAPSYETKIKAMGIPFYGFKKALDISANADIDAIFPERKNYKGQVNKLKFDLIHVFILRSPEYYADILEIQKEFPFDLMIADITFGGIPFVREKMNIPVISVSVIPLPETSKDLAPPGLGLMPSYTLAGKLKQRLLRYLSEKFLFAKPTKVMRDLLAGYGINTGKAGIFDMLIQKSTLVLQSGTPGFEYRRTDMSPHIKFAGPLLPYSENILSKRWYNEKLREYEKVILVTQGTVEKDAEKLLVPTLEAFKNSNVLVIATTGGSQTEELRKRFPQENLVIEDFISFNDVMPYADVYISNGGYGGVLLSIQHQLPMVVAGIHEGKNEINARIGYFKLGINLKTEKPGIIQLRSSVDEIFSNPIYSQNVKILNREFSNYQPGLLLEKYAAGLLPGKSKSSMPKEEEFIY